MSHLFSIRERGRGIKEAQEYVVDSYLTPYVKIHSRRIVVVNMKIKTIKLLEDNEYPLDDFEVKKHFLNREQKVLTKKQKNKKKPLINWTTLHLRTSFP